MGTPFLGQITMMSFSFPPKGWAFCNGQLLPINQNQALFSLLGTTYGGDGRVNFALPNLQSLAPVHVGNGFILGQTSGATAVTLDATTIPTHTHTFNVTTANASLAAIGNTLLPAVPMVANAAFYATPGTPALQTQTMAAGSVSVAGGSQPHENRMPSLCVNFVIAISGIFPSRT
jgi:microcystin-dependent protein